MRAVFMYHSIDPSGSPISLDPDAFERQIAWLTSTAVTVVPLHQLVASQDDGSNRVALTFDDGFVNFAELAWPRLAEHGLTATLFVVPLRAGGTNDWTAAGIPNVPRFPLLDWDELGALAEQGVELGSHTSTHADLAAISDARAADEIDGAAEEIGRRVGKVPTSFAFPYGRFNDAALNRTRARYSLACTTELRWVSADDPVHQLPRLDMYYLQRPGHLERFGSPSFKRGFRIRAAARTVKNRVAGMLTHR